MRQCDPKHEQGGPSGADVEEADAGQRALDELLRCSSESADPGQRLALASRFAVLAACPATGSAVRRRALRALQDLATRKDDEAPCVRGIVEMKRRSAVRHGR